jgi:hypothetical protein
MGYGDEIMALGRAEIVYKVLGSPVAIYGVSGRPRHDDLWIGNPAVDKNSEIKILDGPSARPYILRWTRSNGLRSVFNPKYRARAGHVYLTDEEKETAAELTPQEPFGIIEPHIRKGSSINKNYGFDRWAKVIKNFPLQLYQFTFTGEKTRLLPGVRPIPAPPFRISMGIMASAKIIMCNDSSLNHVAASVGVPAVVVWGGFCDPLITGYKSNVNFYVSGNGSPCGNYSPCDHCKRAMAMIKPEDVREAALKIIEGGNRNADNGCEG